MRKGEGRQLPLLSAGIVVGNTLFIGHNRVDKTDPKFCFRDKEKVFCTIHAEMAALQKAKNMGVKSFRSCRLYVVRKYGIPPQRYGMAKPCWRCAQSLYDHGFKAKNIHFTNWEGQWETLSSWDEYPHLT